MWSISFSLSSRSHSVTIISQHYSNHLPSVWLFVLFKLYIVSTLIARFMGSTWGPSGAGRTQVGPMLAPWTLLSGYIPRYHPWADRTHVGPMWATWTLLPGMLPTISTRHKQLGSWCCQKELGLHLFGNGSTTYLNQFQSSIRGGEMDLYMLSHKESVCSYAQIYFITQTVGL